MTKTLLTAARVAALSLAFFAATYLDVGTARADAPDLAAACRESSDEASCAAAAVTLEASSPETALELVLASCTKRPDRCGALVAYAQRALKRRDVPNAQKALERGCDARAPRACAALAAEYEEGERGIGQDFAKAARYHERACDLGVARACTLLAVMAEDGRGIRRDPARAQKLRARSESLDKVAPSGAVAPPTSSEELQCRKTRDAQKCSEAGALLQTTDAVKAEEVYRIGCATDKTKCGLWAFAMDRLRRDDPTRGMRIFEEGCVQGTGIACAVLADLHHTGYRALARDEARAAELYDRACTLGEPAGCRATAARYRGVRNAAKADELRLRAASLETEADKAGAALQENWLNDAAAKGAREPFVRELNRRAAEWKMLAERSRARWELRMKRLAEIDAGNQATPLPPPPATDPADSAARMGAIQRMSKALFPK